jgi:membrane protein required for colicin V production
MNTFDIIILALLLFGFIRGLFKGLFIEIASLVALITGVYGAIHFSYFVGNFLANRVSWDEKFVTIISFSITFGIIVLVISLIGKLFTKIADFASLGLLNKILGGLFGVVKIGLILSVILLVFNKLNNTIPFISEEQQENAILFEPIKNFAPALFPDFLNIEEDNNDNKQKLKIL